MEWLVDLVNNPLVDKSFAVVLVFVLLRFLREDMKGLGAAIDRVTARLGEANTSTEKLHQEIKAQSAHQTTRMGEIREAVRDMYRLYAQRGGKADDT